MKTRSIIWHNLADQLANHQLTIKWPLEGARQYPSDHWDVSSWGMGEWRTLQVALDNGAIEVKKWTDSMFNVLTAVVLCSSTF